MEISKYFNPKDIHFLWVFNEMNTHFQKLSDQGINITNTFACLV